MGAPRVSPRIYAGLEAVVAAGRCSLYQRSKVALIAVELGYPETAEWVMADKSRYAAGLFHGFTVEGEEEATDAEGASPTA